MEQQIQSLFEQGVKQLESPDCEGAIATFDRLLELDSNHTDALGCRGVALGRLKRYAECIDSFNRAI